MIEGKTTTYSPEGADAALYGNILRSLFLVHSNP